MDAKIIAGELPKSGCYLLVLHYTQADEEGDNQRGTNNNCNYSFYGGPKSLNNLRTEND